MIKLTPYPYHVTYDWETFVFQLILFYRHIFFVVCLTRIAFYVINRYNCLRNFFSLTHSLTIFQWAGWGFLLSIGHPCQWNLSIIIIIIVSKNVKSKRECKKLPDDDANVFFFFKCYFFSIKFLVNFIFLKNLTI